ncbi:MAG: response regulator [Anaerolinea sp.]|nr:response regulator [Anaerolinea sp.]
MAILVVDDDRTMQTLISAFLSRHGYEVLTAVDAIETLRVLSSHTPELIILDIMMPGINGVELCRALRTRPDTSRTPIIIMSSLNDPFTRENCLLAGANTFLNKQDLPTLPEVMRKIFGTGKLRPHQRSDRTLRDQA